VRARRPKPNPERVGLPDRLVSPDGHRVANPNGHDHDDHHDDHDVGGGLP
jgi:hypothetical protein